MREARAAPTRTAPGSRCCEIATLIPTLNPNPKPNPYPNPNPNPNPTLNPNEVLRDCVDGLLCLAFAPAEPADCPVARR